jgi:hypothetical protein
MQVFHNALGTATVSPGETLYWNYFFFSNPQPLQPWLWGNVGLCYAMPQPQMSNRETGNFWTLLQGTGQESIEIADNVGTALVNWYVNIQSDPGNRNYLQYDLQIAAFEL